MIENTFIQSPTYQDYLDNKDDISKDSLVFVAEEGKEKLITQGKEYNFVPGNMNLNNTWYGTQDEYDALGNYDNNTIYYITEE